VVAAPLSICWIKYLATCEAAGWCSGAPSPINSLLPFRIAHTACCAALRT
jgi:hypothetical protein